MGAHEERFEQGDHLDHEVLVIDQVENLHLVEYAVVDLLHDLVLQVDGEVVEDAGLVLKDEGTPRYRSPEEAVLAKVVLDGRLNFLLERGGDLLFQAELIHDGLFLLQLLRLVVDVGQDRGEQPDREGVES